MAEGEVYATLVANPAYWEEGNPKVEKISFVHYSPKEALRSLTQGNVDLVTSLIAKDTLKVAESQHATVVKGRQDARYTVAVFNLMSPHTLPLRRIRVREALNHAVNREELIRYAFKGNADEMRGVLTDKSGVDLSDTKTYNWDIPKARELLKDAGFGEGFKNICEAILTLSLEFTGCAFVYPVLRCPQSDHATLLSSIYCRGWHRWRPADEGRLGSHVSWYNPIYRAFLVCISSRAHIGGSAGKCRPSFRYQHYRSLWTGGCA